MKLSTKSRYGLRFMLDLAFHSSEGPVQLGVVARRQGIAVKYLEHIAARLKKANYITSVRGPKGGHLLSRPREEINVAEVATLLQGGIELAASIYHAGVCDRSEHCVTRIIWAEATDAVLERLQAISLRDLMNRVPSVPGPEECDEEDEKP